MPPHTLRTCGTRQPPIARSGHQFPASHIASLCTAPLAPHTHTADHKSPLSQCDCGTSHGHLICQPPASALRVTPHAVHSTLAPGQHSRPGTTCAAVVVTRQGVTHLPPGHTPLALRLLLFCQLLCNAPQTGILPPLVHLAAPSRILQQPLQRRGSLLLLCRHGKHATAQVVQGGGHPFRSSSTWPPGNPAASMAGLAQ